MCEREDTTREKPKSAKREVMGAHEGGGLVTIKEGHQKANEE